MGHVGHDHHHRRRRRRRRRRHTVAVMVFRVAPRVAKCQYFRVIPDLLDPTEDTCILGELAVNVF